MTGASGGVGSVAVALLAAGLHRGGDHRALDENQYLKDLGASRSSTGLTSLTRANPAEGPVGGAVDVAGSHTLANILAGTSRGVVTACGLAAGMDLPASVARSSSGV